MRFLLLALLLPSAVAAQGVGTLTGRVTDERGEGLPGANVILDGTTLGAATDADGAYRIIGIPVETYSVTASSIGYGAVTHDVTITNGPTRTLDFVLTDAPYICTYEVVPYCHPLLENDAFASRRVWPGGGCQLGFENLPIER